MLLFEKVVSGCYYKSSTIVPIGNIRFSICRFNVAESNKAFKNVLGFLDLERHGERHWTWGWYWKGQFHLNLSHRDKWEHSNETRAGHPASARSVTSSRQRCIKQMVASRFQLSKLFCRAQRNGQGSAVRTEVVFMEAVRLMWKYRYKWLTCAQKPQAELGRRKWQQVLSTRGSNRGQFVCLYSSFSVFCRVL